MGQCWYNFILCMLFTSSVMIMTVAVLLIALATWMLADRNTFLVSFAEEQLNYEVTLYLLLGLGIILAFVSILACCGACKKSRCNVMTSFCIMLVCIVWQISFGVWVTVNSDRLKELLKSNMINTIKNEYGVIESRTQIVDAFQYELECCGATGPADWAGSKYANKDPSLPFNLTVSSSVTNIYNVPESCCKMTDSAICNDTRKMKIGGIVSTEIHNEGCMDKLAIELSKQTAIVGIISIGLGLLEFLFICISLIFVQMLAKERYKA
ncbi:tetraspanin-1 [Harpegnathos saltator]|uniref:Tetraspanin n=1 Tax=Harpegnathos saltator TaxID=610380 RepID=E2C6Z3_HARSA|nr:tetraspanin-1 [Harpegnathos saltator]EFN76265.1 CD82 antigen [Harpegnathos saltator]